MFTENINSYMNREDVKKALHVDIKTEWQECNLEININYDKLANVYWAYPSLLKEKVKVLIYSGDVDMAVPTIESFDALRDSRLNITL